MNKEEKHKNKKLTSYQKFIFILNGLIAIVILAVSAFYPSNTSVFVIYGVKFALIFHAIITAIIFCKIIKNDQRELPKFKQKKLVLIIFVWILIVILIIDNDKANPFIELYLDLLAYITTFFTWCRILISFFIKK